MLPIVVQNASQVQGLNRHNCRTKPATCNAGAEQKSRFLHGDIFSLSTFAREGFGTHIPARYAAAEKIGAMRRSATRAREK